MIHGPTSHTYYSQRLRLHYVDWGNPDAPPLILLHGGRDHCRSWDWVAEELRHDWHVIAPDLRGHGDSEWSTDGTYNVMTCVYDLAQLIHQKKLAPVTIVSHSYGGNISLRYTGLYPDSVRRIVAIEGLGPSPKILKERESEDYADRIRKWVDDKRGAAGRTPRKYASLDEAYQRMKEENGYLSAEQAKHLTIHGISQNEDGSYSWKFDNYFRVWPPFDIPMEELHKLWGAITCPTLLLYGADSWASNPAEDGRIDYFKNAEVKLYENAGHWLHHDQFDRFMSDVRAFI
ncbi:alpha/beta hydrolase [Ponticaulis sp.]|uniref:alpha/beta fold hydrolase n=1 Tax=Ponticaulis sp. TaxID=2020902 RepID=UPI000C4D0996|nr:alpha/beta hydrolase [Ponticaulis sp.]MAJ08144.1 alpha/beta hydrolase [Ponticaulis sp.]HBJ91956.1 alpha/beta hydrolase [Hyphomonadaceae bacterium]|tara:strand:- start:84466 stop:85332 length:867 start_codon:yes stop_codon:yes gene_type:complete